MSSGWKYFCCMCADPGPSRAGISYRRYSRKKQKGGSSKRSAASVTLTRRNLLEEDHNWNRGQEAGFQMLPIHGMESKYKLSEKRQDSAARLIDSPKSKKRRKIQDVFHDMPDGSHFRSDKIPRLEDQPHYIMNYNPNNQTNNQTQSRSAHGTQNSSILFTSLPVEGLKEMPQVESKGSIIDSGFFVRGRLRDSSDVTENSSASVIQNVTSGTQHSSTRNSDNTSDPMNLSVVKDGNMEVSNVGKMPIVQHVNGHNSAKNNFNVRKSHDIQPAHYNGLKGVPSYASSDNQPPPGSNHIQRQKNLDSNETEKAHSALIRRVSPRTGMMSFPASKQNRNAPRQSQSDVGRQKKPTASSKVKRSSASHRDVKASGIESMYGYVPRAVQHVYASKALEGNRIDDFFVRCHNERVMNRFASPDRVAQRVHQSPSDEIEIQLEKFETKPENKEDRVPERLAAIFDPSRLPNKNYEKTKASDLDAQHTGRDVKDGNDVTLGVNSLRISDERQKKEGLSHSASVSRNETSSLSPGNGTSSLRPSATCSPTSSLRSFPFEFPVDKGPPHTEMDKSLEEMWDTTGEVLY